MKAICIENYGNDFDPKVGEVVDLEVVDFYITGLWRDGEVVDLEDPKRPGYFKPESEIISLLLPGDEIEENYCHGRYRVV